MVPKLEVDGLYKIFGENPERGLTLLREGRSKEEILAETGLAVGVRETSFEVREGEIFVVMGLSGSGKSTLVRMLNGLITPTAGAILIDGIDIVTAGDELLRDIRLNKITMVFQHFALFPHKTVAENVAYGLKIKGLKAGERYERATRVLEQVGLGTYADSYPEQLSGGMQQRVGLARALAVEPEILLMDEPFSALDPLIRKDMQEELLELQRTLQKTIVFITHDLNEALVLGDRIAIMKEGRFVQVGPGEEIVGAPANDYVAAFTQDVDRSRVFDAGSIVETVTPLNLQFHAADDALRRMEELERNALYVVDGDRIAGVVTYQGVCISARGNGGDLGSALIRHYPSAGLETRLADLYPLASEGLPIAITDERGALIGVVEPEAVFAQLAGPIRERRPVPGEGPARA